MTSRFRMSSSLVNKLLVGDAAAALETVDSLAPSSSSFSDSCDSCDSSVRSSNNSSRNFPQEGSRALGENGQERDGLDFREEDGEEQLLHGQTAYEVDDDRHTLFRFSNSDPSALPHSSFGAGRARGVENGNDANMASATFEAARLCCGFLSHHGIAVPSQLRILLRRSSQQQQRRRTTSPTATHTTTFTPTTAPAPATSTASSTTTSISDVMSSRYRGSSSTRASHVPLSESPIAQRRRLCALERVFSLPLLGQVLRAAVDEDDSSPKYDPLHSGFSVDLLGERHGSWNAHNADQENVSNSSSENYFDHVSVQRQDSYDSGFSDDAGQALSEHNPSTSMLGPLFPSLGLSDKEERSSGPRAEMATNTILSSAGDTAAAESVSTKANLDATLRSMRPRAHSASIFPTWAPLTQEEGHAQDNDFHDDSLESDDSSQNGSATASNEALPRRIMSEFEALAVRAPPSDVTSETTLHQGTASHFRQELTGEDGDSWSVLTSEAKEYVSWMLPVFAVVNETGVDADAACATLVPGILVAGRYLVHERLGEGVFAQAYHASDRFGDVCLKRVNKDHDTFQQSLDEVRILNILQQSGDIENNNVLRILDYFVFGPHLFIVSELLGPSVADIQVVKGGIDVWRFPTTTGIDRLREFLFQVLSALRFVHRSGIIHADVTPANILTREDTVEDFLHSNRAVSWVLADFGSACFAEDKVLVEANDYVQSRPYRSPEVIRGEAWGIAIDIWSVGALGAELWTGNTLFDVGEDSDALAIQQESFCAPSGEHPSNLADVLRDTPFGGDPDVDFSDLLSQMLCLDPAARATADYALTHPYFRNQHLTSHSEDGGSGEREKQYHVIR